MQQKYMNKSMDFTIDSVTEIVVLYFPIYNIILSLFLRKRQNSKSLCLHLCQSDAQRWHNSVRWQSRPAGFQGKPQLILDI